MEGSISPVSDIADRSRSVPKLSRSRSEMKSALSSQPEPARSAELSPFALARKRMDWLRRHSLEVGIVCQDSPAPRNGFPGLDHRESVATPRGKAWESWLWLRQESLVSEDFPVFSLWIRDFGPETSSRSTRPTAIESVAAETSRALPVIGREVLAIPRGFGRCARTHPHRRLWVPGSKDAAPRVYLCCQVGRPRLHRPSLWNCEYFGVG